MMPTKEKAENLSFTTATELVSSTRFNCSEFGRDVQKLFDRLRSEKTTGKLEIHLHQGGIQRATLLESSEVEIVP